MLVMPTKWAQTEERDLGGTFLQHVGIMQFLSWHGPTAGGAPRVPSASASECILSTTQQLIKTDY